METKPVDAGEHIPLIHYVIRQMGLTGSDAEEAFSEGLVSVTVAALRYDPERNMPIANWLARNIRWDIKTMRSKQRVHLPITPTAEASRDAIATSIDMEDVRGRLARLTDRERKVILYTAFEFKEREITEKLGITIKQLKHAKYMARRKLKEN